MKYTLKVILILCLTIFSIQSNAQVAINQDNADAHASAILDVKSTDKGVLIPRMTATQRDNITSPATGLMVYITDDNSFYFFNGATWQAISASNQMSDADNDTKIQVEESADEDIIRFDVKGDEAFRIEKDYQFASTLSVNTVSSTPNFLIQNASNFSVWQSFKATQTGKVGALELYFWGSNTTGVTTYTVRIYQGTGTGGTLLTTVPVNAPVNSGWQSISITDHVELTQGATYTIWISKLYGIGQKFGNVYADGTSSWDANRDIAIRLYSFEKIEERRLLWSKR